MARVRLSPDRLGFLRLEGLERDRVHRGDGGQLDQTLGVRVVDLRGHRRQGVEPRNEQS